MAEEIKIDDSNVDQEESGMVEDSFDEKLVAVVERGDVARLEAGGFDGDDDLPVGERGDHGAAVDPQHRHPERGDQNGGRRDHD